MLCLARFSGRFCPVPVECLDLLSLVEPALPAVFSPRGTPVASAGVRGALHGMDRRSPAAPDLLGNNNLPNRASHWAFAADRLSNLERSPAGGAIIVVPTDEQCAAVCWKLPPRNFVGVAKIAIQKLMMNSSTGWISIRLYTPIPHIFFSFNHADFLSRLRKETKKALLKNRRRRFSLDPSIREIPLKVRFSVTGSPQR
jgi:hypothetical protein